jgi:hypothetical protein
MHVVGRANDDRVDLLVHLVKHPAEVTILSGLRVLSKGLGCATVVNVTKRHDILTCQAFEAERGLTTGTNEGDVESLIR